MPVIAYTDIFDEIVILLLVATLVGMFAVRLRQPLIIGFIAVGILVGPSSLNWIRSVEQIHALAQMGLALLLFIVGLKLDIRLIRGMGRVALATGLGQVLFTSVGGFLISLALGMNAVTSMYVAVALTFSSTIIIVKLLSDKKETGSLHGQIALGFLIVQDIVVVLAMIGLSAFSGGKSGHPAYQIMLIALKGTGFLACAWVLSTFILPRMLPLIARTAELLVLFGIMWAFALANLGEMLGFSKEIGAFLAGISLASTPYRDTMGVKLVSLRDFLLLFFFIELGSSLDMSLLGAQVWSAIPLSIFVLVGNPIIVMVIMGLMGYRKRTSFLAGLTVAQISEFSLILIAMGAKFGHLGDETVGLVTLVGLITIGLSTYLILYSQNLYSRLAKYLGVFERKVPYREDSRDDMQHVSDSADTLVFGLGSYGTGIAEQLEARGRSVLGVDFDPQAVKVWRERGWYAVFGDAKDVDVADALHLEHIRWVVSSIRDDEVNNSLLTSLRQAGYSGYTAIAAYGQSGTKMPADLHTDLILDPYADAAVQAADLMFTKEEQVARKAMDRLIETMTDHYVICGYGRMGQQIVKDLGKHGVPCVVVESNPEQLPKLRDGAITHVEGRASEDSMLLKAGIERAKGLIAVSASDEDNVFIVLTARVLNPNLYIVARSILKENEDKLRHAGADMVVSPYILGGRRMAAAVIKPDVMDFLDLVVHTDGLETEMAKITVPPGSSCVGKSLCDISLWQTCEVTLLAVRRAGEDLHANPSPSLVVREGDEFIVMGTPSQISAATETMSSTQTWPDAPTCAVEPS